MSLYTGEDKQLYLSAAPVKETEHLRKDSKKLDDFTVNGEKRLETLFENNDGAFELELQLVSAGKEAGFELLNSLGEKVKIYLDASEGRVVMDRAESGIVDFGAEYILMQLLIMVAVIFLLKISAYTQSSKSYYLQNLEIKN